MSQRAPLPARLGQQGGQGIRLNQLQGAQQVSQPLIRLIRRPAQRQNIAADQRHRALGKRLIFIAGSFCGRWRSQLAGIVSDAGKIAQFPPIPFAHVVEMAVHDLAAAGDGTFLLV